MLRTSSPSGRWPLRGSTTSRMSWSRAPRAARAGISFRGSPGRSSTSAASTAPVPNAARRSARSRSAAARPGSSRIAGTCRWDGCPSVRVWTITASRAPGPRHRSTSSRSGW